MANNLPNEPGNENFPPAPEAGEAVELEKVLLVVQTQFLDGSVAYKTLKAVKDIGRKWMRLLRSLLKEVMQEHLLLSRNQISLTISQ